MKLSHHLFFWTGAVLLFGLFLFVFKSMLMPFVLGIAVAYFLNPLVNILGGWKLSRGIAAAVILCAFLAVMGVMGLLIGPILGREVTGFIHALPGYIENVKTLIAPYLSLLQEKIGLFETDDLLQKAQENSNTIITILNNVLHRILSGGSAILSIISFVFLMPVVAFYMMKDWPAFSQTIDDLWPRKNIKTIRGVLKDIDGTIAAFVRGQVLVAFILGFFYGIALTLMGLEYGFFVGFTAGLLGIVPYLGSMIGLLASVVLAWLQFTDITMVALAGGIFIFGQIIEGNFLTPKLVGDKVGLHALWVIFALIAGSGLLGFTGLLIAVPFAAVIGVLLRFGLTQYKSSPYYT